MRVACKKGMSVAHNLAKIKDALGNNAVKLIAVTKHASLEQIEEAFQFGVTEFGENRVQSAAQKRRQLSPHIAEHVNWHFIGHLQTNKVKEVVGKFALIHSVDSLHLAKKLSVAAEGMNVIQPILLQVKVVEDPGKSGFTPEELIVQFAELKSLPHLTIEGLMTIAPLCDDQLVWRRCFRGLSGLRDAIERQYGVRLTELSMGMTQDWPEAVLSGSTMIRLGRAIFG